jgi:hypothetical protein
VLTEVNLYFRRSRTTTDSGTLSRLPSPIIIVRVESHSIEMEQDEICDDTHNQAELHR